MSLEFLKALDDLVKGLSPVVGGSLDGVNAMSTSDSSNEG